MDLAALLMGGEQDPAAATVDAESRRRLMGGLPRPRPDEMRSANTPSGDWFAQLLDSPGVGAAVSAGERGVRTAADVGGTVLGELTGIPQAGRAGQAMNEATNDPSIANITNAAAQTAMSIPSPYLLPRLLLGSVAGGYGAAAISDVFGSSAKAADRGEIERKLRAMPTDQLKALQQSLGVGADGKAGPATVNAAYEQAVTQEATTKASQDRQQATDIARVEAEARGKAEAEKARALAEVEAQSKGKGEVAGKVADAKQQLMADLLAARTPAKDETATGALYGKLGLLTPIAGGIAGGALARAAGPSLRTGNKIVDNYVNPGLAGAELGGALALAPTAAEAFRGDKTNPEYRAWQGYKLRLPAEAQDEISRAEGMSKDIPPIDPSVTRAQEDLGSLKTRGLAMLQGALGGIIGNLGATAVGRGVDAIPDVTRGAGRLLGEAVEGAGSLPGRAVAGYQSGMAGAATARGERAVAQRTAAEAEALALAERRSLEAAQRDARQAAVAGQSSATQAAPGSGAGSASQATGPSPPAGPAPLQAQPLPPAGAASSQTLPNSSAGADLAGVLAAGQGGQNRVMLDLSPDAQKTLADVLQAVRQPAAASSRTARIEGPGPWAERWSEPAREAVAARLAAGGNIAGGRGGLTQEGFARDIAGRLPPGTKGPGKSEAGERLRTLRSAVGDKPTAEQFAEFRRTTDPTVFAIPTAAGAGAAAALSSDQAEAAEREIGKRLSLGQPLDRVQAKDVANAMGGDEGAVQSVLDDLRAKAPKGTAGDVMRWLRDGKRRADETSPTGYRAPNGQFAVQP